MNRGNIRRGQGSMPPQRGTSDSGKAKRGNVSPVSNRPKFVPRGTHVEGLRRGASSSYRGRGRGTGPRLSRDEDNAENTNTSSYEDFPAGSAVGVIDPKELKPEKGSGKLEEFKVVASYNWIDRKEPTVLVPGGPAKWAPPAIDRCLEPDKGIRFIDQNAARYPKYPLEPMFRALKEMSHQNIVRDSEIVICRNTLTKFFKVVDGSGDTKPINVDVEIIGDKVVFLRREKKNTEAITEFMGFGKTFPEEYTSWDHETKGSTSHHRIATFKFCDKQYLFRFESNGYFSDINTQPKESHKSPPLSQDTASKKEDASARPTLDIDADELTLDISLKDPSEQQIEHATELTVQKGGYLVGQESIFEIKTRAGSRVLDFDNVLPRMWFSQTNHLIAAFYFKSIFERKDRIDMTDALAKWGGEHRQSLLKLAALINTIGDAVRNSISLKCRVTNTIDGRLRIIELDAKTPSLLPDDLYEALQDD